MRVFFASWVETLSKSWALSSALCRLAMTPELKRTSSLRQDLDFDDSMSVANKAVPSLYCSQLIVLLSIGTQQLPVLAKALLSRAQMANDQLSLDHVAREILIRSGTGQVTQVTPRRSMLVSSRNQVKPEIATYIIIAYDCTTSHHVVNIRPFSMGVLVLETWSSDLQ